MKTTRPITRLGGAAISCGIGIAAIVIFLNLGRAQAQPVPATEYKAYSLKYVSAADVEQALSEKLAGTGSSTQVVADAKGRQILVRGPDQSQQIARQVIDSLDRPPPTAAALKEQFIPLIHVRPSELEAILRQRFRERLVPLGQQRSDYTEYRYVGGRSGAVRLGFDGQRSGVVIFGSGPAAKQWGRLMHSLDVPPQSGDEITEVVPLYNADPRKVQEAVEASRAGGAAGGPTGGTRSRGPAPPEDRQGRVLNNHAIRLVTHLFQTPEDEAGGKPPAELTPVAPNQASTGAAPAATPVEERLRKLRDLGLDVEIETLPDLDAIIIRGRKRDVEEAKRIIQEIERLSVEAEPAIELYQLRHVQGEALSDIIRQVQVDILSGHQGRVTILPLGKPNALLLIGWGETVKKAKELIAKLDQPVDPLAEQRVFRLRNAAASAVSATITQFFATPFGLEPRIKVTADPRTNSLVVRAAPRDLAEVEMLVEKLDSWDTATVFRTRIFKLYNTLAMDVYATLQGAIDAARGAGTSGGATGASAGQKSAALELLTVDPGNPQRERLLRSGILNDVRVTPDPRLNLLLISAPPENMDLLAALIKELDSPGAVAQIKVFRIVNGDANAMSLMLRSLLPAQTGAAGPPLSVAEGEPATMGLRFSTDVRTNSIIAIGSTGDLRIVEALIMRLDALDVKERKTIVVRLKNSPANDVANAVNRFLSSQRTLQLAAAGATSPFQQLESEVVVVAESVSNSLIISATPRFFVEISELVEKLDAQPAQVMIQVLIAEVTLGSADEFGVEMGLQDSVLFDRSALSGNLASQTTTSTTYNSSGNLNSSSTLQSFPAATLSPGYLFNSPILGNGATNGAANTQNSGLVGGQGLTSLDVGRVSKNLGFGGLVLSASSDAVSVLLRALQESHRMEVLGRPHIMTLDNQPAFIQIGKRVPRVTGNMVSTVGVGQVYNTFELVNVGLILGVTPRISPDGMVVMEIDAEKSEVNYTDGLPISITGTTTGTDQTSVRAPAFDTTMVQTTVSAADGETIVLGGLIQKSDENVERKVPYLGDIPVLGNLFKYHSERSTRRELLIVLTPHVVRDTKDAERIKRIESARMHWCLQAVREIHNDAGLTSACEVGEVIYPDENPWGTPEGAAGAKTPNSPESRNGPEPLPVPAGNRSVPAPFEPQLAPPVQRADPQEPADPQSRARRLPGPEGGWAAPVGYNNPSQPASPYPPGAAPVRAGPADRP